MTDRKRPPKLLTLDPATIAILDATGPRGASAYVDRIVQERDMRWRAAHRTLWSAGWTSQAMLAAMDALNGYAGLLDVGDSLAGQPAAVAAELADAQSLHDVCRKRDVPPARWATHVRTVAQQHEEARALLDLSREFWAGNAACEAAIRRVPR